MTEKLSRLEKWFAENQEKALKIIEAQIFGSEKVINYVTAWSRVNEIIRWIPIIGDFFELRKKKYLLAVTDRRFLIIRIRMFRFEELSTEDIPISHIRDATITSYPLFTNLRITTTEGKNYLFKDLPVSWAAGMKDGIDEAQGKPSSYE